MNKQSCKLIEAENIKALAEKRANAHKTKVLQEAEAYRQMKTIEADTQAKIIMECAETRYNVAKNKSQALIKEATAEEKSSAAMEGIRRHTEKMKLAASLQELAKRGKMVISGKNGQQVMDFFNSTIVQVGNR